MPEPKDKPPRDLLELAPETTLPEPERASFLGKLKRGLFMTQAELVEKMSAAVSGAVTLDERTLEYLEENRFLLGER